jgi:hypothetical protein
MACLPFFLTAIFGLDFVFYGFRVGARNDAMLFFTGKMARFSFTKTLVTKSKRRKNKKEP